MITRIRGEINTRVVYVALTKSGESIYNTASSKMASCCDSIYRNIDEQKLTMQLLMLSSELNKLNN